MIMKNPPHPGGVVLRQCIEPLGLNITDAGLENLTMLTSLRQLNLPGTHVTAAGVGALQRALPDLTIKR